MKSEEEIKFIKELINVGLCGIEVYNPNNGIERRNRYLKLCKEYSLVPTVGSDIMDGNRKPLVEIGKGINDNLNISDTNIIDMLK